MKTIVFHAAVKQQIYGAPNASWIVLECLNTWTYFILNHFLPMLDFVDQTLQFTDQLVVHEVAIQWEKDSRILIWEQGAALRNLC